MDRRVVIAGGIVAAAVVALGIRMVVNTGAKTGLDDALTHLPPGYTATHGAVSYNGLTGEAQVRDLTLFRDGTKVFSAGSVAVSGVGAADETGTPRRIGEVVIHDASAGPYQAIQRINLTGVALATLRAVMDPAAYPGGKPAWTDKRPVIEHAELHGLSGAQTVKGQDGKDVKATFGIALATMDGVRLSQLPAAPDVHAAPGVVQAGFTESLAFTAASAKDIAFDASSSSAAAVSGHIARVSEGKADGGHIGDFEGGGIAMTTTSPAGTVSIAGFSGHGLDASKALALLPALAAAPGTPHPELLNGMRLEQAEMHGITIDYPSGPLVTLDSVSGGTADKGSSLFALRALTIKTTGRPLKPDDRAALESFGMQDFTTDLTEQGGYDPDQQEVVLKRCDIDFHQLGTLHFTMTLSGIPATPLGTPAGVHAAIETARLNAAALTWDDASLTGRLIRMAAAKQGMTPEQLKAGLALPLASLPVLMPEQPDAAAQIQAFLDGQHQLSIRLSPPVPVGLAQWNGTPAPGRAALLGVQVSGN